MHQQEKGGRTVRKRCAGHPAGGQILDWLDHILKTEIGKVVDWSKVDKEDYLLAMERSPIKDVEIKVLLKAALSDEINSREVYLSGIDQSYYYEGYTTFEAEDLSKE